MLLNDCYLALEHGEGQLASYISIETMWEEYMEIMEAFVGECWENE